MIKKIYSKLLYIWSKIIASIAFLPSVILLFFLLIAVIAITLEDSNTTKFLEKSFPFLLINNADTARTILGTLIGGIISLTVFSFSMVMIILNEASSSFSPRLLPGLISDKRNQFVLGIYLGTITYNIIVLISILPDGNKYTLKGFSLLMGIIMGIVSLGIFVLFIHSISTNIQIDKIIKKIYDTTSYRLDYLIDKEDGNIILHNKVEYIFNVQNEHIGYFQGVELEILIDYLAGFDNRVFVKVIPYKGQFMQKGETIFETTEHLTDDEKQELRNLVNYNNNRIIENDFVLGVKQLTEVAVKAMSPGINDPGTAIIIIDHLTDLLLKRMQLNDGCIVHMANENIIEMNRISFNELLTNVLVAIRQYAKHDVLVMKKLTLMLIFLKSKSSNETYTNDIDEQLLAVKADVNQIMKNPYDAKNILEIIEQ